MNTPPCRDWKIWEGPEIEGHSYLGDLTLFVRKGTHYASYIRPEHKRIWICKEMLTSITTTTGLLVLRKLKQERPDLTWAFEVPYEQLAEFRNLRHYGTLYIKLDLNGHIADGDVLCVGRPYHDRFYTVQAGDRKVSCVEYTKDKCLEA